MEKVYQKFTTNANKKLKIIKTKKTSWSGRNLRPGSAKKTLTAKRHNTHTNARIII